MRVTIIADASYCSMTGAAGYGIWAVSERGGHADGGSMSAPVDSSSAAEMMALVNGFKIAFRRGIAKAGAGDHILLQTDCQRAIDVFESRLKANGKGERAAKARLYELKREFGCTVSFRHVKGHSKKEEARYVTNNLCDKRAKKGMRLARKKIEETQVEA